jgi:hypothetical protein
MADTDWKARIKKWEDGIKFDTANTPSKEDVLEYIATKIHQYTIERITDDNLWYGFKEDFRNFELTNFSGVHWTSLQRLRGCLRCGGVRVEQNTSRLNIAQSLYNILLEETPHTWSAADLSQAGTDFQKGPMTSVFITADGKHRRLGQISDADKGTGVGAGGGYVGHQSPPRPPVGDPDGPSGRQGTPPHPLDVSQATIAAKLIGEIAKIVTNDQKYDGTNGSFNQKQTIFHDICRRVELPKEAIMRAFPIMLKGLAQDHFYNHRLSERTYDEACENIRGFFEGPAAQRSALDKWNSINLADLMAKNTENKPTYEVVQSMVKSLRELQYGLSSTLQNDDFLHNKIVTACQGVPACRFAVSDPPPGIGPLVNKLQSSIITYEKEQKLESQTYFTDRRYRSKYQPSNRRFGSRAYDSGRNHNNRDRDDGPPTCHICKREDCRSWKHTPKEQAEEKARFLARNNHRFNTKARNFNVRFDRAYSQYLAETEGDDEVPEDDLGEAFEALLVDNDEGEDMDSDHHKNHHSEHFFTSVECLLNAPATPDVFTTTTIPYALVNDLNSLSFRHQLIGETPTVDKPLVEVHNFSNEGVSRYTSDHFYGIVIDTGASEYSTAGFDQFQALQRQDENIVLNTEGRVKITFGIGSTLSIGSVMVETPIGQVEFHVMHTKTPFLLSLADMDRLRVYFNNLTNGLVLSTGDTVPVVRRFGHPFLLWDASLQTAISDSFKYNPCFLTETELRRLHRRFGHPSVRRLQDVLYRAGHDVDKETLEYLTNYCKHCQKHGRSPGRFQFTLKDDVNFNYSIIVDIFYISGKPVLHIVDEGTRYQAGRWLQNISAKHAFDTLKMAWVDSYLGPPDQIITDAGKQFTSKEFAQLADSMGTKIKIVPIEAHNSIGIVERYHGPIRRAYNIITAEIPDIHKDMALQMAFKAINDSVGPDGLVPTLLVYGALPRMIQSDTSPTVAQRSSALKKAMAEIQKLRAKRQVEDALNTRNGPSTTNIHDLPLNSDVLVWREGKTGQTGSWEGPYKLVAMDGESCVLALPYGNTTFRSTSVKPYLVPDEEVSLEPERNEHQGDGENTIIVDVPLPDAPQKRHRGRPLTNPDITVYLQDDSECEDYDVTTFFQDDSQYETSRETEIAGLLEKGVFEVVPRSDVPEGVRIFNSRFVDEIKNEGTNKELKKSRLVVQAYHDDDKHTVLTQSPTIQRISQRVILSIAAMTIDTTGLYLRDISQAYVQSTSLLNRDFYIKPPRELATKLNLEEGSVVKVLKPLYGVPESGNHWYKTYHSHHVKELSMEQSTYDPCLLYSNDPFGLVGLQTDDTLFVGNDDFAEQEQVQLKKAKFKAKERERLTPDHDLKFNGAIIHAETTGITLTQERQCKNLKVVNTKNSTSTSSRGAVRENLSIKDQYAAQRARGAYIASVCQPEAAYDLSVAAQAVEPTEQDIKALNKRIQWQLENAARGLRFVKLEKESLQLMVFTDASFANNKDLSSQIGYILVLADGSGRANILHWSSTKCKRVTRSVLASELYGMAHGFDMGVSVKSTIDKALQINLPLVVCTDSKSAYECLVKLGTTQEKRLMIDVMCLRQAYERREIAEVKWIKGDSNPADSMTKAKPSNALKQLIETNTLQMDVEEWVERE